LIDNRNIGLLKDKITFIGSVPGFLVEAYTKMKNADKKFQRAEFFFTHLPRKLFGSYKILARRHSNPETLKDLKYEVILKLYSQFLKRVWRNYE
jgi:hypothetical protein